jgi:bifunctional non-homologous end joining protein LigD
LVVQVAFAEWTAEGRLRQPSFLGLRDDVDPRSVVREAPESPGEPADGAVSAEDSDGAPVARVSARESDPLVSSGIAPAVAGVTITNPDKRLFPDSDLTKLELARYYEAVAPLMLPEVGDRPLTLVRCPVGGGAESNCFYQRHPDRGLPAPVATLAHALAGHTDVDEWLHVSNASGLVALAQMGVAEIHTWLSRTDEPRRPDRIVLDLDPGPDVEWSQIVRAAGSVREAAEQLGFSAFLKNTGSKGLHVVLPIEPVWEFERIRVLARLLAERVAAEQPDKLTSKMAKTLRTGRIFIDYVRNSEAASAVAAYSTRYLPGPTVAVPLAWDELDPKRDIRREFTPERVLARVQAGIDPWVTLADTAAGSRVLRVAEKELGGAGS